MLILTLVYVSMLIKWKNVIWQKLRAGPRLTPGMAQVQGQTTYFPAKTQQEGQRRGLRLFSVPNNNIKSASSPRTPITSHDLLACIVSGSRSIMGHSRTPHFYNKSYYIHQRNTDTQHYVCADVLYDYSTDKMLYYTHHSNTHTGQYVWSVLCDSVKSMWYQHFSNTGAHHDVCVDELFCDSFERMSYYIHHSNMDAHHYVCVDDLACHAF
jgi:hypothetical protein